MEPGGQPRTPGTSYGLPAFDSAQNSDSFLSCTLQSSCSPDVSDGPMSAKRSWTPAGDEGPEKAEASDPGRSAQRRFRSSAFPSSLSWDSDSEKETLDEEELQHFSNPHGLAAHSPGSPSAGLRLDSEEDQEPEKWPLLHSKTDSPAPEEEHNINNNNESTKTDEPNTSQLCQTELSDSKVWNVSEGAELFLSKVKPKDGCQTDEKEEEEEADNREDEKKPRGKETKEPERDVYSFPGDSDPESPPPAPWAHCTFIQRCRKKRVLLRPFSGLGTLKRSSSASGKRARASPQKSADPTQLDGGGGVYDFEGFEAVDEPIKFRDRGGKEDEESGVMQGKEIFTCVECSIYFKKQQHLQEHMVEHCQKDTDGGGNSEKDGRFQCLECGWNLPSRLELADHHRRHQESRVKILEEIEKLNESGNGAAVKHLSSDLDVTQDAGTTLITGKLSDPEIVTSPPLSPLSAAALDSDATPPNSARAAAQARRRFVCTKCNFSTRTPQALANHSKTHNRKKQAPKADPGSSSCTLSCGLCAFQTSSQALMREHQKLAHQGHVSGSQGDETRQVSRSKVSVRFSKSSQDSDHLSGSESETPFNVSSGKSQEKVSDSEDCTITDITAAPPKSQVVFKCVRNRRFSRRGKTWTSMVKFHPNAADAEGVHRNDEDKEQDRDETAETSQREANSPAEVKQSNRARLSNDESIAEQSASPEKSEKKEDELDVKKDGKVFFLRRRHRVPEAPIEIDSDDDEDDIDEDSVRHFLSEDVLDEDDEDMDEEAETMKSVERKCPYCPDRFHNGIGLANHVRGHLNRVGVSYNVRHFISPEEVNAIEKKFSYQKKKKKVHSLKCEVCGARFETKRGLSIHARYHLRRLGIGVSENSGAAITLLHQIAKEQNIKNRSSPVSVPLSAKNSSPTASQKDEVLDDMDVDEKPIPLSILAKAAKSAPPSSSSTPTSSPGASPAPPHSGSPPSVVRKAPISSLLPVSSPLRSPEHKAGGMKSLTASLSSSITTKPLWAPEDDDAPLNLTLDVDPNKDIVCQLCGAWFETRKGLSSHARAHLRHFGVEYSESKGSPIDLLHQLMDSDDFKHKAGSLPLDDHTEPHGLTSTLSSPKHSSLLNLSSSSSTSSSLLYKVTTAGGGSTSKATSSSASALLGPPAKRPKSSSMRVFRLSNGELMALPHNEPPKEIGCEFCGEYFENRKGLSSHARSHLRQMGITEWSVNGSPIDTLREIITRRGLPCALPLKPLKTPPPSSPGPPRSPLSASSSPSASLLGRLPFAFARPSSPPPSAASKSSSAPPAASSGLILKLKPEPVQLEVTAPGAVGKSAGLTSEPLGWSNSDSVFPLNLAMSNDVEPTRDIRCEFCGEYFENRKGLSSHARSHLRQMGITEWSVNGSPIDTLREVMHKRRAGPSSVSDQGVKKESSQGANSPPWETTASFSSSEGHSVSAFQSSKYRKSPLSLLQSGSRLHKQGLTSVSASGGKFFSRMSTLGKRPLSEESQSAGTGQSPTHQLKTFSPVPHDYSYKRKPSPDKPGHQDPSCELCGFFFENRKALASHARAHLRQFGVTEWCVNGSPIETLSAWMRSRPQKVLEMHRSYMQGSRSTLKKKSSSSHWSSSSLAVGLVRPLSREVSHSSSKTAEDDADNNLQGSSIRSGGSSPSPSRLAGGLPLQAQVARSELNVRLPRGFERRPLKHPSLSEGTERDSGPPKPPRTSTVPALVPKPPSYPLVKLVGKFYTLKCRFCEVEFHGPLSVQEDWIRHLQQHILNMNYNKPAAPKEASAGPPASTEDAPAPVQASTSTSSTASTPTRTSAPNSSSPTPPSESAPPFTATKIVKVSEEQPAPSPAPLPLPAQTV
ncbi:protein Wiz-like isoform X4 [Cheilinus undulatus]|uniref:protein Wiz-like isoform X4 n=1 Tax=Cheilinus undulatus TaxID=241271 RepID=UPI001BD34352|nr:protein Wiz-like isoform X4 [Cheilinus undulatus]